MVVPNSLRSLRNQNYRRYFVGQVISFSGSLAQGFGLAWLVLDLSNDSGVAVGLVTLCQFLPLLVLGLWAGVLADRIDKRRLYLTTQSLLAVLATVLAVADLSGVVSLPVVYVLAFLNGAVVACDSPVRLAFVVEMVSTEDLPNAIALNTAVINAGRVVGPALGGLLIVTGGTALCFVVNAVSFLATIGAVLSMDRSELRPSPPIPRKKGQISEGLRYTWGNPLLRAPLLVVAMTSLTAFNFPVVLPLLAKITFHGTAGIYSLLATSMGVGALISACSIAALPRPFGRRIVTSVTIIGAGMAAIACAPSVPVAMALLTLAGAGYVVTISSANAMVQLDADPPLRGRVSAIYALSVQAPMPFGGFLAGTVAQLASPRWAVGMGAIGATAALAVFGRILWGDHVGAVQRLAPEPDDREALRAG